MEAAAFISAAVRWLWCVMIGYLASDWQVQRNADSLELSWEEVIGAVAYEVVYSPISDPNSRPLKKRVFSNQVTLEDLEPGKAYNIQVNNRLI